MNFETPISILFNITPNVQKKCGKIERTSRKFGTIRKETEIHILFIIN